jgi:hypothetical protein
MTEAEWNNSADSTKMLKCLRGLEQASERKLRLFAIACCRSVWTEPPDGLLRHAVEIAEQYAEGQTTKAVLKQMLQTLHAGRLALPIRQPGEKSQWWVYWVAEVAVTKSMYRVFTDGMQKVTNYLGPSLPGLLANETSWQCALLRDIFGNPFHPTSVHPGWLTWNDGTIPKLAQAIYDERAFDRLPILADALEEAGCADADILSHCRQPGAHVRGCWVVDLLLGKS